MIALQRDLHNWRKRNFPTTATVTHQFMGMVEELGELAHAMQKQAQGIRGTFEEHDAKQKDAIADLVIYAMGFCSARGWNFESLVEDTATDIMKRDWQRYPYNGVDR